MHEIILQKFIYENIKSLNMTINIDRSFHKIIDAKLNPNNKYFWDLIGKLDNGTWIPIEVEWESKNFKEHKHLDNINIGKFKREHGVVVVLRKSQEISGITQISIFDNNNESKIIKLFKDWFVKSSPQLFDETINEYITGKYTRTIPRIIINSFGLEARNNYIGGDKIYKPKKNTPALMGFKENAYNNNKFVQDLKSGDIILFINCTNTPRGDKKSDFINKVKNGQIKINYFRCYRIISSVWDAREINKFNTSQLWWKDEIKKKKIIYPYRCECEEKHFFDIQNVKFPYIKTYTEDIWIKFFGCLYWQERHELSPLFFTMLISHFEK